MKRTQIYLKKVEHQRLKDVGQEELPHQGAHLI